MLKKVLVLICALALMLCAPAFAEEEVRDARLPGVSIVEQNGLYGYRLDSGEWLVEPVYSQADPFVNGYARVAIQTGEIVKGFSDTEYYASLWGLIDANGKVALPLEYDSVENVGADGAVTVTIGYKSYCYFLTPDGPQRVFALGTDVDMTRYIPFVGRDVAQLDGEPDWNLRGLSRGELPRLDGATALYPVYAAFAEAVYPDNLRYHDYGDSATPVMCTKTNHAYESLIEGDADIIFCAGPSDAQIADAAAAGVEFELTPFGKEAFVFIVNAENPLENITVSQIRQVYSGQLTQWDELGVSGLGEVIPYQRPANSGSQTALERLMGDVPIMQAPGEYVWDMMDKILQAIEYRNLPNAIGYSFRFFCTEMMASEVKLLSIDGVAPTAENIRNGSYPITTTLYAVTRKGEEKPYVRELLNWITSEQGQELVEKSGYVGWTE